MTEESKPTSSEEEFTQAEINLEDLLNDKGTWQPNCLAYFGTETRSIYFHDEVNPETSAIFVSQIFELDKQGDEEPIFLFINTPGGDLPSAMAMYDVIKTTACPVIGITLGECASAGLLILSACDYRAAYKSTRFFFHEPQMGTMHIGSNDSASRTLKEYQFWSEVNKRILTGIVGEEVWRAFFTGEFYFSAQEAYDLGLIQKIIQYKNKKVVKEIFV